MFCQRGTVEKVVEGGELRTFHHGVGDLTSPEGSDALVETAICVRE